MYHPKILPEDAMVVVMSIATLPLNIERKITGLLLSVANAKKWNAIGTLTKQKILLTTIQEQNPRILWHMDFKRVLFAKFECRHVASMLRAQKNTLRGRTSMDGINQREWVALPRKIGRVTYRTSSKNEQTYPFKRGAAIYLPLF